MDTILEEIRSRVSVRSFLKKEIGQEKMERVLEAARLAPSACNLQPWKLIVVRDRSKRIALAQASCNQSFMAEAPIIIVCCARGEPHLMPCGQESYPIDCAIALDHLSLQAVREGLGTCWIGAFWEPEVRRILSIPDSVRVVELMPLGYPAEPAPERKDRKPIEDLICYDDWSNEDGK